jgi:hypothetical protein
VTVTVTRGSQPGDGSPVTLRSCWWARLLGRHPLVRTVDRVEAIATLTVVALVIMALPFACAYGTSVHDRSSAEQALRSASREVTATVTADSTPVLRRGMTLTRIRWFVDGEEHNDVLSSLEGHREGDQIAITVDGHGNRSSGPVQRAPLAEAIIAALSVWLATAALGSAVILRMRSSFRRKRFAQWDRELQHLIRP